MAISSDDETTDSAGAGAGAGAGGAGTGAGAGAGVGGALYECEHDCGYEDTDIALVETHEGVCTNNPTNVAAKKVADASKRSTHEAAEGLSEDEEGLSDAGAGGGSEEFSGDSASTGEEDVKDQDAWLVDEILESRMQLARDPFC
jgi:hypothetical protein